MTKYFSIASIWLLLLVVVLWLFSQCLLLLDTSSNILPALGIVAILFLIWVEFSITTLLVRICIRMSKKGDKSEIK